MRTQWRISSVAAFAEDEVMLTSAEVSLLVEIGFWAIDEKLYLDAEELFDRLASLQSVNPYPRIGLAMLAYSRGQRDGAIDRLQGVLRDHPEAVFTRSLLARFMKEGGQVGWERYAREALERVQVGSAADLARALLAEAGMAESHGAQSLPVSMAMKRV
jgi:predicted Zn-dependent protease